MDKDIELAAAKARLREIDKRQADLNADRREATKALIDLLAEFKVGDRVTNGDKTWKVTGAFLLWGDQLRYRGRLIKKDGTPGVRSDEFGPSSGRILTKVEVA